MAYRIYVDRTLLPIPPEEITVSINSLNETVQLVNGSEINVLLSPGLSDISFTARLSDTLYPFSIEGSSPKGIEHYLDKFEQLKTSNKPFRLIISRTRPDGSVSFSSNFNVGIEGYTITENAENGLDVDVELNFKQWREYGETAATAKIQDDGVLLVSKVEKRETSAAPTAQKTYVTRPGATLWNIAKAMYGDGEKYTDILAANRDKISSPNNLPDGIVLRIPR